MLRNVITFLLAAMLLLLISFVPASALPETSVSFDEVNQEVMVSITDGNDGTVYTVKAGPAAGACVDSIPGSGSIDLTGPDASGAIPVECIIAGGEGVIIVNFCMDINCFDTKYLVAVCDDDCNISAKAEGVPALTNWGIAVLVLFLIGTTAWVVRRRRTAVD